MNEVNIFPIENLGELSAEYRMLKIVGLQTEGDDYDSNIQYIIRKLSYTLRHPVTVVHRDKAPFLVIKDDPVIISALPGDGLEVKQHTFVVFEDSGNPVYLDFEAPDEVTKHIIMRFLQFDLSGEISKNDYLWQPGAGDAFFSKRPWTPKESGHVDVFNGFNCRVVELPAGGFGVCVDITKKYISKKPLSTNLTKAEFSRFRREKCKLVYRYGSTWFEIRPDELSDMTVANYKFRREDKVLTLLEDIRLRFNSTLPPNLANLPDSAAVLLYRNKDKEAKGALAAMCYRTYDTESPEVKKLHTLSIVDPFNRRRLIRTVRKNYLSRLKYGNVPVKLANEPLQLDLNSFDAPDLLFNDNLVLSTSQADTADVSVPLYKLGKERKKLLLNPSIGFYTRAPYDRQYVIMPETLFNTYGGKEYFLKDLMAIVDKMHPTEQGWNPTIIPYDDRNNKHSVEISMEILERLKNYIKVPTKAYAVVILPSRLERVKKEHDEAAAAVVSECLKNFKINASIMHTEILSRCFRHIQDKGQSHYIVRNDRRSTGLYKGYLTGVAINQVLLNNERWPFILSTPLNADLIIGIDVKQHVAGFTFVDKYSHYIFPVADNSKDKEKLSSEQVGRVITEGIRKMSKIIGYPIKNVVIHRDGRIFRSEKSGINQALQYLRDENIIDNTAQCHFVEIPKKSKIPFRVFDIKRKYDVLKVKQDNQAVLNPKLGTYLILNQHEGYVCTTGREFNKKGTANPLYIRYSEGAMTFEKVLQDIYSLSHLAYTKPDDCSRTPLTIKVTDRKINLLGSSYESERMRLLQVLN